MAEQDLLHMHPADAADLLEHLTREEALCKLRQLVPHQAAEPLQAMEAWASSKLMEDLATEVQAEILNNMDPDDSVDILQQFESQTRAKILGQLDQPTKRKLSALLTYPADTAGGIMSPEVVTLSQELTVEEAMRRLRSINFRYQEVNYVYAVDDDHKLTGVVPLRGLAFQNPDLPISQIMAKKVATLKPDMDQEKVARTFDKYDYLALPVVDETGAILGVVTADDIIDVVRQEDTEDMLGMVGVSDAREVSIWTPWFSSLKHRLPWLAINLGTAILAASVVGLFEGVIQRFAVLAVFMPVIAGQGGNAGSQTVAIVIRSIALEEVKVTDRLRTLSQESWLGLIQGLFIGVLVGMITYFWQGQLLLAVVVSLAMILTMVAAGIAGVLIPLALQTVGLDPALSSNIWVTTVTDVFGFLFLLGIASWILV